MTLYPGPPVQGGNRISFFVGQRAFVGARREDADVGCPGLMMRCDSLTLVLASPRDHPVNQPIAAAVGNVRLKARTHDD
jgi:hypothetical protein